MIRRLLLRLFFPLLFSASPASRAADPAPAPRHTLRLEQRWFLVAPHGERFDASALLFLADGSLLTVNDKGLPPCRIETGTNGTARLIPLPQLFAPDRLQPFARLKTGPYDCEGLARDNAGRIYLCEEGNRWILRCDPATGAVERLTIDWKPVEHWFSRTDSNASFEGIAIGGNRLYVANERSTGRIFTVDLTTLRIVDDFQVAPPSRPARDVHYSDLCFHGGHLWVLCRESRCVLQVDPASHRVLAEFDYTAIELAPENAYYSMLPYGFVEGLAVTDEFIWLCVDNNGYPRVADRKDTRPVLFRCRRPDRR